MERILNAVVLSDVHLGTFGCQARELLNYLQSIQPEVLILNGDFIDGWQFTKRYFPPVHIQVIYEVMKMAMNGTKVYYLSGNHDEFIRKFIPFYSGNIYFRDQLELEIDGKRHLFFHGDAFDFSIQMSPLLAKMGGFGYDNLIRMNTIINAIRLKLGFERISFAHSVKSKIKQAINFIKNFEEQAVEYGISKNAQFVICGHIHIPNIVHVEKNAKKICYMNSGDWVENLSALEYKNGNWSLYTYDEMEFQYLNRHLIYREKPAKVFNDLVSRSEVLI
ncbi:MAG: UDP-2,3-diacylglucosamine diphosphatase [Saprospiraceae bacterium]|nr:UDP-2,3-diacylglucosamine diphosphatase [Saprospiraceae bacterium]MBK8450879.1 UDP-2,3-diacylglucosamine diphosphatase [Saprospiraceae bacterium]MBK8483559.1 UDP-2,3-diacylglucosamine diphosphatase [Saprospiraceae bacterium]MBK9223155.1 UDP-2,3-diacylglucosamine diphosphatase [Saprospiraceae bacterium]MBK9720685.1 UDP-2,3-diacylglucosamine diphosphatase [Saprospiraceae bacterium]